MLSGRCRVFGVFEFMSRFLALMALAFAALMPMTAAQAQQNIVSEVRAGVFAHAAHPGWVPFNVTQFNLNQVEDIKFDVLFHSPDIDAFNWIGSPRPHIGATINLDGQESFAHLGLTWTGYIPETPIFVEGTLGAAVHNGILQGAFGKMRPQGCRFSIYTGAGIGIDITEQFSAILRYDHISNNNLCAPNYGLSNLGISIGMKFN